MLGVRSVLVFPKIFRFDLSSSMKVLSTKVEKIFLLTMVPFYPGMACHHLCQVKAYQ